MGDIKSNEARFLFETSLGKFSVLDFSGKESVSMLYRFKIRLVSNDDEIQPEDLIKKQARLIFLTYDKKQREISGIIGQASIEENVSGRLIYSVTLHPFAWLLAFRKQSRIFQNMSVPEIIARIIQDAGFEKNTYFKMELSDQYPSREYCVQHNETDYHFISRISSEEGIFFFFIHNDGNECMVFGDDQKAYPECAPAKEVEYHPVTGTLRSERETLSHCSIDASVYSGKVVLKDYNYENPGMQLQFQSSSSKYQELEIYDHPGGFRESDHGEKLALKRRNALMGRKVKIRGRGTYRCLAAGHKFTVSGHSQKGVNGLNLVLTVNHRGRQSQALVYGEADLEGATYDCSFVAVKAVTRIYADYVIPKPKISLQSGVIVGPSGEEIYTDEHGRVKVQFHWDREGKKDGNSSCWIRVSQAWAGSGWGSMHIPRIGQEVIVDFFEGDPDKPVIIGRVYNGENLPPYPNEKTRSGVKSNSTIGGGGSNEIRFEDKKGEEEFFTHAQKDQNEIVENCMTTTIKADKILLVEKNRTTTVKLENDKLTVEKGIREVEVVTGNETHKNGADFTHEVMGNFNLKVGGNLTIEVSGTATIKGATVQLNP